MPLPRVKKSYPDRLQNLSLRDGFAWRVKMPAYLILFPPFLIPGEKGGAVCRWHTIKAPTGAVAENALRIGD